MTTQQDSALDPSVIRRLHGRSPVDIMVGLPTYKNSRTIGSVMTSLGEGLRQHYPDLKALVVVSDGGSTDDTIDIARNTVLPTGIGSLIAPYVGITGKGSAIRAILEVADRLDAKACAIVDADVRSVSPDWVERLLGPVLAGEADYVSPLYTRDRHEVTINDMIAYPLTRALYGRDVRQPLGGEVALTPLAWKGFLSKDVWETDVARFGIHIWMVSVAINAGWRLYQAPLGTKTHDFKDPTVGFEPKFMQIVGTMFRMMSIHRRVWPEIGRVMLVPTWGTIDHLDPDPVPITRQTLWDGFRKGVKRYRRNIDSILDADQRELIDRLLEADQPSYPVDAWARTVADFSVVYNRGEGDPDKVALSLLPLYYARKATMLHELEGQPWTAVEDAIQAQAEVFLETKPHLVERWIAYLPWQSML